MSTRTREQGITRVETFAQAPPPLEFSDEQRRIIRDSYANGASDAEFAVLMEIARSRRLNPLLRQIHFVNRWDGEKCRHVWSAQASIDGLRAVAERTGLYAGQDEPEFVENPDGTLKLCKVRVWRRDWPRPAVGIAYWNEYVQTIRDRQTGKTRPVALWGRMPRTMLAKCLPGGARIETDQGSIRIANIVNRRMQVRVRSVDLVTGREVWARVVRGWRNGGTDTWVRLWAPNVTHGNQCLRLTPDHPVWTSRGWVPAGELRVGDHVAVASPTLSRGAEQVLLGSLLGDGTLGGRKTKATCPHFAETHTARQSAYLRWKAGALSNLDARVAEGSVTVRGARHAIVKLWTRAVPALWALREAFYEDGRKKLDRALLDRLGDLGVAVWIMDDGALQADRRWPSRPRLRLYTCCFSLEEHDDILSFFSRRYGLRPRICRAAKNPYVTLSADDTETLLSRLRAYLVFDPARNGKRWVADPVEPGAPDGMAFVPVLRFERYTSSQREGRYDIEVEGTHTFLYNNVVVSNCAEALALRRAFPEDMGGLYTPDEMGQSANEPPHIAARRDAAAQPPPPVPLRRELPAEAEAVVRAEPVAPAPRAPPRPANDVAEVTAVAIPVEVVQAEKVPAAPKDPWMDFYG